MKNNILTKSLNYTLMKKFMQNLTLILCMVAFCALTATAQSERATQMKNPPKLEMKASKTFDVQKAQTRIQQLETALTQDGLSAELKAKYQNAINRLSAKIEEVNAH